MARGTTRVLGFSPAGDCRSTVGVLRRLGAEVSQEGDVLTVYGRDLPATWPGGGERLDCGRSATTMRLVAGALAGRPATVELGGDPQLLARPMERVAAPLRLMGASVGTSDGGRPPVVLRGGPLTGIRHRLPVASAQVKSAVLLAGLQAEGPTVVEEPAPSRDHTERLLAAMGATLRRPAAVEVEIEPGPIYGAEIAVPGDASSAAFLVAAAALVHGSDLTIHGVGLNPGRAGLLRILSRMGGSVEVSDDGREGPEPAGDVRIRWAPLSGVSVGAAEVPAAIDELPLVGLLATQAEGVTRVAGAGELRVKESDRIRGLVAGLRALGAQAEELPDGFAVAGPSRLDGGAVDSLGDHRLAMTFAVAGLIASRPVRVEGMETAADSFPGFADALGAALTGAGR